MFVMYILLQELNKAQINALVLARILSQADYDTDMKNIFTNIDEISLKQHFFSVYTPVLRVAMTHQLRQTLLV